VAEHRTDGKPSAKHLVVPVQGNPATQYLLRNQTPLVIDNAQSDSRLAPLHGLMRQRNIVSLLILPLNIKKEVVGSLNLTTTEPRPFSTEEVNLAWSVAEQLAGALARTRLGQARRLLSAAVEQSAESILITDTSGAIIYVNPTFEKVSGYSGAEVLGQTPRILKSDRHEVAIYQDLWATISAGQVWHNRLTNQKKDGSWYTVDAIIAPVRDEKGTIVNYLALQRDITNELQLEEQLRQSQKMEAVGRLAGGMAHDFNNLLTVINGHADLLLERYESPDDPRREDAEHIRKAGKRAVMLTRQLLAFSRRQPLELQLLNLSRVVANLEDMLRRLIGEHITLTTFLTPELDYVRADPGQIEQVILNLVVNARDAMPQGGRLDIVTENIDLDKSVAEIYRVTPGPQVGLMIIDTGVGIESETQRHIFEPFFTTKELGKGTGLGLLLFMALLSRAAVISRLTAPQDEAQPLGFTCRGLKRQFPGPPHPPNRHLRWKVAKPSCWWKTKPQSG
jgi:PAS domain S-box-containing protein